MTAIRTIMLQEEVDSLLRKIERELVGFVAYVKNVEEEYNRYLPDLEQKLGARGANRRKDTSKKSHREDHVADGSAIVDSFNIVKNVLLRIANLIDEFSSLPTEDERNIITGNSYLISYYYSQYVCQIAYYLVKIVEEHLGHFSEKVNQLASPLTETKVKDFAHREQNLKPKQFDRQQKETPTHFTSRQQGKSPDLIKTVQPAMTFPARSHGKYQQPLNKDKISKLKQSPEPKMMNSLESIPDFILSDEEFVLSVEEEESTEEEEYEHSSHRLSTYANDKETTDEVMLGLGKSFGALATEVQELLSKINNDPCARLTKTPPYCKSDHWKKLYPRKKKDSYCPTTCTKWCDFCIDEHGTPKNGKHQKYWRQRSSWDKNMLPDLNVEPFWMVNDPKDSKNKRKSYPYTTCRLKEECERGCSTQTKDDCRHQKLQTPENYGTHSLPLNLKTRACNKKSETYFNCTDGKCGREKIEPICPGKARGLLATGEIGSKTPNEKNTQKPNAICKEPPRIKKIRPDFSVESKVPLQDALKESLKDFGCRMIPTTYEKRATTKEDRTQLKREHGSRKKPIYVRDMKEKISYNGRSENEEDSFILFPGTKQDATAIGERNSLVHKSSEEDGVYPRSLTLDVLKFSNLLREKFKHSSSEYLDSEGKPKANRNVDIIFDSLFACVDIGYKTSETALQESESENDIRSDSENEREEKSEKSVDSYVREIMEIATKIVQVGTDTDEKKLSAQDKKALQALGIFTTTAEGEENIGILIPRVSKRKGKGNICQACKSCRKMVKNNSRYSDEESAADELFVTRNSLEGACFRCWNGREQGHAIHQCHDCLPKGVLEVRHMDSSGKKCVCFLKWDRRKEQLDWRWQKNPFHDPTRVEVQQEASYVNDPVLKVIYGPEENMVKESLAETRLKLVHDYPVTPSFKSHHVMRTTSAWRIPMSPSLDRYKRKLYPDNKKLKKGEDSVDPNSVIKVGRFFDEIQKVGYGKGPILILKLRRKNALNDAFDLLMVPSKIPLNYYRNLRVLLTSDDGSIESPTSSNFFEEDESSELFEMFAMKLFNPGDLHLFEYPSRETQYLYLNSETKTRQEWFVFGGIVLSLAILHQKKMDINLAPCLYKCLLDRPLHVNDLKEIDPLLHQNIRWLKENDVTGRKSKTFFVVKDTIGSQQYETELIIGGKNIEVTERNKFRYIDLTVKWKLAERCLTQLKDFRKGFGSVIEPAFLTIFSEKELLALIKFPPHEGIFLCRSLSQKSVKEVTRRLTN